MLPAYLPGFPPTCLRICLLVLTGHALCWVQPEFLQPAAPLSVLDVMAVLRRHFDGTEHDGYGHK